MRIPDDIRDLILAFLEPEKKAGFRFMTYEQIDELLMREIACVVEPGYLVKTDEPGAFPYRLTDKGIEILKIIAPCKRSGR
ncbi:MAG: hypothetical protein WBZ29_10115 [Methanocella sp.]